MTTPKQKRLRKREAPECEDGFARFQPILLDERFDELGQADAEFSRWRWPGRDDLVSDD